MSRPVNVLAARNAGLAAFASVKQSWTDAMRGAGVMQRIPHCPYRLAAARAAWVAGWNAANAQWMAEMDTAEERAS